MKLCASIKYLVQRNPGRAASAPTIYDSVEIHVLIFYFFGMLITYLQMRDMVESVWHLLSTCTSYQASINHLITFRLSFLKISGMYIVPRRYWSTCISLCQSSLSVSHTFVVNKATPVWMYFMDLGVVNRSCATLYCNYVTCSSSKYYFPRWGIT